MQPVNLSPDSPVDALNGIGVKTKQLFQNMGIGKVGDLLLHFPRAYEKFSAPLLIRSLPDEEISAVRAVLTAPVENRTLRGRLVSSARCADSTGQMQLTWFNEPYLQHTLRKGTAYIFRGKVKKKGDLASMEQPAVYSPGEYEALGSLQPVYSLTKGLHIKTVQKAIRQALDLLPPVSEYLPEDLRRDCRLCSCEKAFAGIHFPKNEKDLQEARRRLVFDEFFFFLLQLRCLRLEREQKVQAFQIHPQGAAERVIASLPYELTDAQKRVWAEIERELQKERAMARLIQGDVGSGKTILAALALVTVAESGCQGALMAPTEVLARQHYAFLTELISENHLSFHADLLTGSMTAREKKAVCARLASGETDLAVGTHALIQDQVRYRNLALVITDEQHRFGVRHREQLAGKGSSPHILVMSATPIPRTLSMILYGDLDLSVLDEVPADRLPVKNCVVGPHYRPAAWKLIEEEVQKGHQAYIICPMAEESDFIDAKNVTDYTKALQRQLPDSICAAFLHGRMKAAEKTRVMERFLNNDIQILVATTVVEVGVNVPNATVMLIENAERFGLAQLHQLRGRIGRGNVQSYCIFLCASESAKARERLEILNHSNDGFEIARRDLQLRGPGDLTGVRQSGMMNFRLADIYADADILQMASEALEKILQEDPDLSLPEHSVLRQRGGQLMQRTAQSGNQQSQAADSADFWEL